MALDPRGEAVLALHRFGLGPKPGMVVAISSDLKGALLADLERPNAAILNRPDLPDSASAARQHYADRTERRKARQTIRAASTLDTPSADASAQPADFSANEPKAMRPHKMMRPSRKIYLAEAEARVELALLADVGFVERLVWFWSNHFCVSAGKSIVRPIAGAFEREAIRPHVLGRFADMLLAVESHPAMLQFLDNARSIGPNSAEAVTAGPDRGLNENLAREILELHTLGDPGVYAQADVTSFAKVITGWTLIPPEKETGRGGGTFDFADTRHEPGSQTVIGKVYRDTGVRQGQAVLRDLARHPATARHIAAKLATHFVSDTPPASLIEKISERFLATDGDLKETAKVLLLADECWQRDRTKLKRPNEWIISALRAASDSQIESDLVLKAQDMLGEPLWRPTSPKGFSDRSEEWLGGLGERINIATFLTRRLTITRRPSELLDDVLGRLASDATRTAVGRAEDTTQALTLLFMSPEFQRR
jgi:uncharacterized protein (DUF1800 family)